MLDAPRVPLAWALALLDAPPNAPWFDDAGNLPVANIVPASATLIHTRVAGTRCGIGLSPVCCGAGVGPRTGIRASPACCGPASIIGGGLLSIAGSAVAARSLVVWTWNPRELSPPNLFAVALFE